MLDELQDVPRAVLILFDKLTELGLFCCGDNAQNIAKGVGYKFFEVQNCLLNYRNTKKKRNANMKIFDLNVNFRSHNQILQLGNSVIDFLKNQVLNFTVKKTSFFSQSNIIKNQNVLIKILSDCKQTIQVFLNCVSHTKLINQKKKHLISKALFQQLFRASKHKIYCIIFKVSLGMKEKPQNSVDQDSKTKLPVELQNALVLTIYEAKGLEFDDVILYNFFTDCTSSTNDWQILRELDIQKIYIPEQEYQNCITIHQMDSISSVINKQKYVELKKLKLKPQKENKKLINQSDNFIDYLELCQELKQLYVQSKYQNADICWIAIAITRPRKRLIIFDQNIQKRFVIQNMWEELNVVDIVKGSSIPIPETQFVLEFGIDNKGTWKKQGYKMFRLNNYDQAAKCFRFAEDEQMMKKAQAYHYATQAALLQLINVIILNYQKDN